MSGHSAQGGGRQGSQRLGAGGNAERLSPTHQPAPRKSPAKAIQINDVMVDEREIVYAVDRLVGGLYTLELRV